MLQDSRHPYPECDDDDKNLLTLYIMMTYVYMGIQAIPYAHLNGLRDSGKSTIGDIFGFFCFNAIQNVQPTAAVVYRDARSNRPTFIIDEAENLGNHVPGSDGQVMYNVCLSSYANTDSAYVRRINPNTNKPEAFFAYGPKIFQSIKPMDPTLASRCVLFQCMGKPKGVSLKDLAGRIAHEAPELVLLRDQLYVWSMTHFRAFRERYESIALESLEEIQNNRFTQIWRPLYALALHIDDHTNIGAAEKVLTSAAIS